MEFFETPEMGQTLESSYLKEWKNSKKKVIGYYCSNMPEEIIHAAGMLPYRMRGVENQDFILSDAILSKFNCTFIRSTLNLALKGRYDFLDGLLVANTCDHVRRMFDIFKLKVKKAISGDMKLFFLSLPHVFTEQAINWYKEELNVFLEEFGKLYSIDVHSENYLSELETSIEIYKKNSELLQKLNELRSLDLPKISGSEYYRVILELCNMRKEDANKKLVEILDSLDRRQLEKPVRARLMVVGSSIDNPDFLSILEHAGGLVVADTSCTSLRSMSLPLAFNYSPRKTESKLDGILSKIVENTYLKCYCPRMMNAHVPRLNLIKELVRSKKIDGIILQHIEFCDLHGCENSMYQHEFEEIGIPTLNIDREYFLGDTGRLRTRVEAFLEKIGRGK